MKNVLLSFTLMLFAASLYAQSEEIEGKIINENNDKIEFATIKNLTSGLKSISNNKGEFAIKGKINEHPAGLS